MQIGLEKDSASAPVKAPGDSGLVHRKDKQLPGRMPLAANEFIVGQNEFNRQGHRCHITRSMRDKRPKNVVTIYHRRLIITAVMYSQWPLIRTQCEPIRGKKQCAPTVFANCQHVPKLISNPHLSGAGNQFQLHHFTQFGVWLLIPITSAQRHCQMKHGLKGAHMQITQTTHLVIYVVTKLRQTKPKGSDNCRQVPTKLQHPFLESTYY